MVEAVSGKAGARASIQLCPKPSSSLKNAPRILPVRRLFALVGRKQRSNISFPHRNPRLAPLTFAHKGSAHAHGSSTVELPSTLAESGA